MGRWSCKSQEKEGKSEGRESNGELKVESGEWRMEQQMDLSVSGQPCE